MPEKSTYRFDVRESVPPFSLLEITHIIRGMKPGQTLDIAGINASLYDEMMKILRPFNFEIIRSRKTKGGHITITIKKLS